jgi:phosphatidylserine/phosphatidylglycerophosphate/cardiolipin synthase-like enzyme
MRARQSHDGLSVNAIAGSYVVLLGIDVTGPRRQGLRGFAIKRTDHTEGEAYWLKGTKVFESVEPHPAAGAQFTSLKHPFQTFQWADYGAKPGYHYTYTVVAMYGDPGRLEQRISVDVSVTTESITDDHTILFNRGSPATQEYARRFQNEPPSVKGQAAYDWLSRGLLEGIIAFIRRAEGGGWGLKGAFYEFQWPAVLDELREAKRRGVDVHIVFDNIDPVTGPANQAAIAKARIKNLTTPRTHGKIMHNKFLVLTHGSQPSAVLLGSTNLTENGIFGQANCVHITESAPIAAKYLGYYEKLATDPETGHGSDYKTWTIAATPAPATHFDDGLAAVFSPRADSDALHWYGELADGASGALFMTFAFGMNKIFQEVYAKNDDVLKFGLMDKEWTGRNREAQIAAIRALQARRNVVIAVGNRIPLSAFDQWLAELDRVTPHEHVQWVHLKFMLVDPLSDHPVVVTGSANFSEASTRDNDENMLVVKDSTRVADIYLGEYMRLYSHYAFREAVKIFLESNPHARPEDMKQGFLIEDGDWTRPYFDPRDTSGRMPRRLYFAGTGT